jgi:phenylpropionate dioxygenase-like ring-hydroxylating dioxygenase large terminal subunit
MEMQTSKATDAGNTIRKDYVPKDHYISEDVERLQREHLWPKVWQFACREEELEKVGDFVRYDVAMESIIVVRNKNGYEAFHNVCPHRGNQIVTSPKGNNSAFYCNFHGWRFDLSGNNIEIKDREDWAGCPAMDGADVSLRPVLVDTWGGFVFINMDLQAEPLLTFLDPIPSILDCVELEKMRYRRRVTVKMKANWLTGITSFVEGYHLYTTHPQTASIVDDINTSRAVGKHGNQGFRNGRPTGAPATRTGLPMPKDIREGFVKAVGGSMPPGERTGTVSNRSAEASLRVLTEVAPDTTPDEVVRRGIQFMIEAAEADGAGWPSITAEQFDDIGTVWTIFPNISIAIGADAALLISARPDSTKMDTHLLDVAFLERFAPGKEPRPEREYFPDWPSVQDDLPKLLLQDMKNIEQIHRGMHSSGFKASRPNPVQEAMIPNLHRVMDEYLYGS